MTAFVPPLGGNTTQSIKHRKEPSAPKSAMILYYNASDRQKVNVPQDESKKVRLWGTLLGPQGLEPGTNRL